MRINPLTPSVGFVAVNKDSLSRLVYFPMMTSSRTGIFGLWTKDGFSTGEPLGCSSYEDARAVVAYRINGRPKEDSDCYFWDFSGACWVKGRHNDEL